MNLKVDERFINTDNVLTVQPIFDRDTDEMNGATVTFRADSGAEGYVGPYSEEYKGPAGMALLDWYENNSVDEERAYQREARKYGPSITEARSYGVDVS